MCQVVQNFLHCLSVYEHTKIRIMGEQKKKLVNSERASKLCQLVGNANKRYTEVMSEHELTTGVTPDIRVCSEY